MGPTSIEKATITCVQGKADSIALAPAELAFRFFFRYSSSSVVLQ